MATRTSTRSTKAVKFVDSADEEDEDFPANASPARIKNEPKKSKVRGRPRRAPTANDDEEWDARNEHSDVEEEEEDDDDDEEEGDENRAGEDVTKKFKTNLVNRSVDSVYDFG